MRGGSSTSGSKGKGKIEDLMKELDLKEDDLDDLVFEEDDARPDENLRWMILVRVHMDKDFSNYWFFRQMRAAWDLARKVKIKTLRRTFSSCSLTICEIGRKFPRGVCGTLGAIR